MVAAGGLYRWGSSQEAWGNVNPNLEWAPSGWTRYNGPQPKTGRLNVILAILLNSFGISSWGWIHLKVDFGNFPTSTHGLQTIFGAKSYGLSKLPLPGGTNWCGPIWSSILAFLSCLLSLQSGSCPKFLRIRKASQEFSSTPFMDDGLWTARNEFTW